MSRDDSIALLEELDQAHALIRQVETWPPSSKRDLALRILRFECAQLLNHVRNLESLSHRN